MAKADDDILSPTMAMTLARTLRRQAEHLHAEAEAAGGFHRPVSDGISSLVKAAAGLADMVLVGEARRAATAQNELMDMRGFLEAADERIDELARQRAAAMVAERAFGHCPACGAPRGPADAA